MVAFATAGNTDRQAERTDKKRGAKQYESIHTISSGEKQQ
jgi:hypothetical protein